MLNDFLGLIFQTRVLDLIILSKHVDVEFPVQVIARTSTQNNSSTLPAIVLYLHQTLKVLKKKNSKTTDTQTTMSPARYSVNIWYQNKKSLEPEVTREINTANERIENVCNDYDPDCLISQYLIIILGCFLF